MTVTEAGPVVYGLMEETTLPSNAKVYYRGSDHSYWRGVKRNAKCEGGWGGTGRLTGVSTLCGPLDFRPDNLLRWVERLTLEGIANGFGVPETVDLESASLDELRRFIVPPDPHTLRTRLDGMELRWEQIRDAAAARGTNVHLAMLHALATGSDIPDLGELPPEQRGYGQGVLRWWMDRAPEVLQAEQVVFSDAHNFAGRFDLRCRVTKGDTELGPAPHRVSGVLAPEVWLPDLKTSGYISNKHHAQLAGYELGAIESGFGESDRRVIVQVSDDGNYREIPCCASMAMFLNAVKTYRDSAAIGKAADQDRKARQA